MVQNEIEFADLGIENASSFWDQLIIPEFERFNKNPSGPHVLVLAILLWNLTDWMFEESLELFHSRQFLDRTKFQEYLRDEACPELKYIWSLCDSAKHRVLRRPRDVAAIKVTSGRGGRGGYGYGSGGYGTGDIAYGSGILEPLLILRSDNERTSKEVNSVWLAEIFEKVRFFYESVLFPGKQVRNNLTG